MKFNYYYGSQAEQFSFIRIPKIMLTDNAFQPLSMAAKVLYGVLLDRMSLSMKNGWLDEEQRVFIIYQIGEIQEDLGFSKKKAMDLLSELEIFGLLEKKRRGHGLPNILYVKSFMTRELSGVYSGDNKDTSEQNTTGKADDKGSRSYGPEPEDRSAETRTSGHISQSSRGEGFHTQEVTIPALQEVKDPAPLKSKTNINNTYKSKESNLILSTEATANNDAMRCDEKDVSLTPGLRARIYRKVIHENISYDDLLIAHRDDAEMIEGIAELMLETVIGSQEEILIASSKYPAEVVKARFLKLNYLHIEYVLHCMKQNTTKVKNIRKYLLATLFNAPSTMDGYYQAEVNHDMPQFAMAR